MRIFAVEYLSTGGALGPGPGEGAARSAAREGAAMLRAVLADLAAQPGLEVATMPPAPEPAAWVAAFCGQVARADAVLLIAPETAGILARLTRAVEESGRLLLGSNSAAVAVAGDKWLTFQALRAHGVTTPPTLRASPPADWPYPLVVKPRDGCGSEGVRLVAGPGDLPCMLDQIVQQYVDGEHVSVSLIAAGGRSVPLSLNRQAIRLEGGLFAYHGGQTAIAHPLQAEAFSMAMRAVAAVPGLAGYVGVDLVLTEREPVVIEINPRLTTPYVGLREGCAISLMGAVIAACRDGRLPEQPVKIRSVVFAANGPVKEAATP
jgi:tyramine---L-glutamate ligase